MKIDLTSIDKENFLVHESDIYGEKLFLVQPQYIGCKWTQENKIFRSSVWNAEGELVSAGFPKFVNWGENPDQFPIPKSLKGCMITEKIDGSLLVVSKYKGQYILRTRGTFNASVHNNGEELELFKRKYQKVFESLDNNSNVSWLFEWVSPNQRIVLNYGDEPDWFLVGIIDHDIYYIASQTVLDMTARKIGIKRPKIYDFNTIEGLLENVELWKGFEGVCLYSNNGQTIHKIKSSWYLALHHLKSEISNIEKLLDVYLTWEMPSYIEFEKKIIEIFDFELFNQVRGDVSRICEAKKNSDSIIKHMNLFLDSLKGQTRKEQALAIISSYGQTAKKGIAFNLLDGHKLDRKAWKTLILQCL